MKTIQDIRNDFPILSRKINGKTLVYLDNAATSQKPQCVIDSITNYYQTYNANIHRGVHSLSQEATDAYEKARQIIQKHIGAAFSHEIIFTSGTTHGINLIANGLASFLQKDDEILVLTTEHHSNIVPWQLLCEKMASKLRPIPVDTQGMMLFSEFKKMLSQKTKIISIQHISNALGNIFPIEEIIKEAHKVGAMVVVDAAQSCPHFKVDVQALDIDFYVASGHKMYAPTGIGFLYAKEKWLNKLPPYQGGGEMIKCVTFPQSTFADLPHKFEAGTPNICGAIALGVAIEYMNQIGFDFIGQYEHQLLVYATEKLKEIEGITIYGTSDLNQKASVISFNINNIHSYDVGVILDKMGIAVRTGNHCAQPIMDFYQIQGTIRASFAIYNTFEEIDQFIEGIKKAKMMLS